MVRAAKFQREVMQVVAVAAALGLSACGSGTNVNKVWGKEDQGGDSLLVEGQAAFDSGNFDRAETLVQRLLDRNSENEDAAILLGFIHLSQSGVDAFTIARKLVSLSPSNTASGASASTGAKLAGTTTAKNTPTAPTSQATPTTATVQQDAATAAVSDAASILTNLSSLVSIGDEEKAKLYLHMFATADNHDVTPTLFTDKNALQIPTSVHGGVRDQVEALRHINQAIKDVCRFVDADAKVAEDSRDNAADCTTTPFPRSSTAKAHFLWVLTHLSEALVFQPVILYTAPTNTVPSLTAVSTAINAKNLTSVAEFSAFAAQVLEVKTAVGLVFNTTDTGSMVKATLQDLNAVSLGFGKLAGLPSKVQDSITKAFSSISSLGKELGSASAVNNTAAFKAQMIQSLSKNIGAQIQAAADKAAAGGTNIDKDSATKQVAAMCASFKDLNAGLPPSTVAAVKPKSCTD